MEDVTHTKVESDMFIASSVNALLKSPKLGLCDIDDLTDLINKSRSIFFTIFKNGPFEKGILNVAAIKGLV